MLRVNTAGGMNEMVLAPSLRSSYKMGLVTQISGPKNMPFNIIFR